MSRHTGLLLLALIAAIGPALADDEVVLKDGQSIRGLAVHRVDDVFLVTLPGGGLASLPIDSVLEVRLGEAEQPASGTPQDAAAPVKPPLNQVQSEPDQAKAARTLAGPSIRFLSWREQLEVLDHPWQPSGPVFSPVWTPASSLQPWQAWAPTAYAPPTWQAPPFDFVWRPTPALSPDVDVLDYGRVQWTPPLIDPTWTPGGAFSRW